MASFISVKDKKGVYRWHVVDKEISIYIQQLECYIKHPDKSKLFELYSERFSTEASKAPSTQEE